MKKNYKHYVYKITDPKTGQYYFGSRSHQYPENDEYMGSMKTWTPEDKSRLVKEIIKDNFETREDAIEFESDIIQQYVDDKLNENYHIPSKGFHNTGIKITSEWRNKISKSHIGKKLTDEHKDNIRSSKQGKTWADLYGSSMADKMKKIRSKRYTGIGNPRYNAKLSQEQIDKQRESLKNWYKNNEHPFKNGTHSIETRKKLSEYKKKMVIHIDSGMVFESQLDAANYFSIDNSTVSLHCRKKVKTQKFKFI